MRNIILATAFVFALSGTAQANVIVNEYVDMKRDLEENIQRGKDQFERNKEQIRGLFLFSTNLYACCLSIFSTS